MKNLMTMASGLIVVAAVVAVGVLRTVGLLDNDTANTAISMLIGLLSGVGIGLNARRP